MNTAIVGPHQGIPVSTARETFLAELFDTLWDRYRQRVSYVQTYEQVIKQAGATFVNDHIAFRTFATQQPLRQHARGHGVTPRLERLEAPGLLPQLPQDAECPSSAQQLEQGEHRRLRSGRLPWGHDARMDELRISK